MTPSLTAAHALAFVRDPGEDRLALIQHRDALILVVADGAGGLSGGARAADLLVERVREAVDAPAFEAHRAGAWVELLARADRVIEADRDAGETTGVVVALAGAFPGAGSAAGHAAVVGASCGDSGAGIVGVRGHDDLTSGQHRKRRLGSGNAVPVPFSRARLDGTLLAATDGLFGFARPERIAEVARGGDLDDAARELVRLVRLPSGGLQDDVGVVLVRAAGG
jgi:serine/threonine protein phosphatase PrpC